MGKGVRSTIHRLSRSGINQGNIIIPDNIDRDEYIEKCLRRSRVSILVENGGGVIHSCYISKSIINDIKFPSKKGEVGQGVIFFTDLKYDKSVVVGIVGDNSFDYQENSYIVKRDIGDNYSLMIIDGNGNITLDSFGGHDFGKFDINVRNLNRAAEMNINVEGSVSVTSDNIFIKTEKNGVTIDSKKNIDISTNLDVTIKAKNFKFNDAQKPVALAEEVKSIISDILDAINRLTVTCSAPGSPSSIPVNFAEFTTIGERLDNILSKDFSI